MASELHEDGEGELLQRIRALTGPALPIAITLDLHANVTQAMTDHADIVVSYKTYPHTDIRERACQAGRLLNRALIKPRTLRFALPMMQEADGGRSDVPAMKALYDRGRELEAAESGILALSRRRKALEKALPRPFGIGATIAETFFSIRRRLRLPKASIAPRGR